MSINVIAAECIFSKQLSSEIPINNNKLEQLKLPANHKITSYVERETEYFITGISTTTILPKAFVAIIAKSLASQLSTDNITYFEAKSYHWPTASAYLDGDYLIGGWQSEQFGAKRLPWLVKFQNNKFVEINENPISNQAGIIVDIVTIKPNYYLLSLFSENTVSLILQTNDGKFLEQCNIPNNQIVYFSSSYHEDIATDIPVYSLNSKKERQFNISSMLQDTLQKGLVAHYPFDGNANDISGNGNHGKVHGAILTKDRFGNADSAYSFDGQQDSHIKANISVNLAQDFTYSTWVLVENREDGHANLISINWRNFSLFQTRHKTNGGQFELCLVNNKCLGHHNIDTIQDNQWQHFVITVNDNQANIFLDSKLVKKLPFDFELENIDKGILYFGGEAEKENLDKGGKNYNLTGKIDDIRIYNRALSDSEIQLLFRMKTINTVKSKFYLIEGGISTSKFGDKDSCKKRGLKIFAPNTKQEYEVAREYLISIGKPKAFGPLGIYHPNPTQVKFPWTSNTPMNSANAGAKFGWKSTAGDTWWISDKTNITEPNGDYTPNCWLSIQYNDSGNVIWYNDELCNNSYTTYLCY